MNAKHANITFSFETEIDGRLPFLDGRQAHNILKAYKLNMRSNSNVCSQCLLPNIVYELKIYKFKMFEALKLENFCFILATHCFIKSKDENTVS